MFIFLYVFGGGFMVIVDLFFVEKVEGMDMMLEEVEIVMGSNVYWGDQLIVFGLVYIGVILVFLVVVGMIYICDKFKWVFLVVIIIIVVLLWGKNYMGFINFFFDYVLGYNKFCVVMIILVIVELCIFFLVVYFLDQLVKYKEEIKNNIWLFYVGLVIFVGFLIFLFFMGVSKFYFFQQECDLVLMEKQEVVICSQIVFMMFEQVVQLGIDKNNWVQIQEVVDDQLGKI